MRRQIIFVCLLFQLCAFTANAQQPTKPEPSFKLYAVSQAVETGSWVYQLSESVGKREASPLFRDEHGMFSAGKFVAYNGTFDAVKTFLAWKFPRWRKPLAYFNFAFVPVNIGLGLHNRSVP